MMMIGGVFWPGWWLGDSGGQVRLVVVVVVLLDSRSTSCSSSSSGSGDCGGDLLIVLMV